MQESKSVNQSAEQAPVASRHPGAIRMGIIAFFSHNMAAGTIFSTFSVMLASVVARRGVTTEQAAVGIPLVVIGSLLLAPVVGVLVARYPLRYVLRAGALMIALAFILLAYTTSYTAYLAVHALLLGPGSAVCGAVAPATLVTRWFGGKSGLTLGIVHLPLIVIAMPVTANYLNETYGAQVTYVALASLLALILVPLTFFITDHPPGGEPRTPVEAAGTTADGSLSVLQFLMMPRFWIIALAGAALTTGSVTMGAMVVPMTGSWGVMHDQAAMLVSFTALFGVAGAITFGWVADRIGGARGLALLTAIVSVLWFALLLHPRFPSIIMVNGLMGMCGAGIIPNLSRAISDTFGQRSFSRGFGLSMTIGLPFTLVAVPGFPWIYRITGTYSPAIMALATFYAIGCLFALAASRAGPLPAAAR